MRTGIFGGVFDPVHRGHLAVARAAVAHASLDRLYFVPTGTPPHKAVPTTAIADRKAMVLLAIEGDHGFVYSDIESGGEAAYTHETVRGFAALHPADELFYVIGFDSLLQIPHWRHYGEILARARLLVAPRPGYSDRLGDVAPEVLARASILDGMEPVEAASTALRALLAVGDPRARDLLPPKVHAYIVAHGLYRA